MEIDKNNAKLLVQLDINARESLTQLAKRLRLSKQVVSYRIKKLEEQGVITGYYPLINTVALGYTNYRVYIKFRTTTQQLRNEIIKNLCDNKDVWAVVRFTGTWDVALGISVKHPYDIHRVLQEIQQQHAKHIHELQTHLYGPITYFPKTFLSEAKTDVEWKLDQSVTYKADATDMIILRLLAKNAKTPLTELADNANIAIETARQRLKKLEKANVIQGYRPIINLSTLGYEYYKTEITLTRHDQKASIYAFCKQHPNITEIDDNIGGADLEFVVQCKGLTEFLKVMNAFESQFPDLIETYTYLTVLKEEKLMYLP